MQPRFPQSSSAARSSLTAPSLTSSFPDIGTSDDVDEEVRPNLAVTNPILDPTTLQLSSGPEPGLAEASPVVEEAEDVSMEVASPVDLENVQEKQRQRVRREKFYGLVFLLFIVAGGIIVGSVLQTHPKKSREGVTTQVPTSYLSMEPSGAPSSAPTGVLDLLFVDLPLHTQDSILNASTPQYQAWEWLSKHQNITNLPDWRKKQLFALAAFFFAFEGENWNPLIRERWMDDTKEECLWFSSGYGYFEGDQYIEWSMEVNGYPQTDSCNELGKFVLLGLTGLQLSGFAPSVPQEIKLLTSLSSLALFYNDIEVPFAVMLPTQLLLPTQSSGLMVSEQEGLSSLRDLDLAYNHITPGPLSSELGVLTTIEVLYLEGNAFSGIIFTELGGMTSLVELTLSNNSFSGTIPSELARLTSLEYLELQNLPLLTGSIPSELSLLTSLLYLDLRNNSGLSGIIPDELCFLKNGSCTFVDWWGTTYNCTLEFECTDMLCGCDCPCAK
jgi:hypothetical protein